MVLSRGGKAAVSPESGNGSGKASDQLENDKSVGALLNTYREGRAIALIIDDRYALFPYSIAAKGCTYAVLGWYQIVKAWGKCTVSFSSLLSMLIEPKLSTSRT